MHVNDSAAVLAACMPKTSSVVVMDFCARGPTKLCRLFAKHNCGHTLLCIQQQVLKHAGLHEAVAAHANCTCNSNRLLAATLLLPLLLLCMHKMRGAGTQV